MISLLGLELSTEHAASGLASTTPAVVSILVSVPFSQHVIKAKFGTFVVITHDPG
jgi:hypothetical protein